MNEIVLRYKLVCNKQRQSHSEQAIWLLLYISKLRPMLVAQLDANMFLPTTHFEVAPKLNLGASCASHKRRLMPANSCCKNLPLRWAHSTHRQLHLLSSVNARDSTHIVPGYYCPNQCLQTYISKVLVTRSDPDKSAICHVVWGIRYYSYEERIWK